VLCDNRLEEDGRNMRKGAKSPMKASKPGPKPYTLKIKGNWERAVKKSLAKKKPAKGCPK
jgi:hypothetical protein